MLNTPQPIRAALALLLLALLPVLHGCSMQDTLRSARPIEDIRRLDGHRVAVYLADGADYLLTPRDDITLVRYNTLADMVTALCYRRVDAVAVTEVTGNEVLNHVSGLRRIETPIFTDALTAIISTKRPDLLAEFNRFVAEFRETPEYASLLARVRDPRGYTPVSVALTGGPRTLIYAIPTDHFPYTYTDVSHRYYGIDVELISHFANACGYSLEFMPCSFSGMELSLTQQKADIGMSGISNLYRADYERANYSLVSDGYMPMDIVFIEVADPDGVAIRSAIEK